MPQNIHKKVYEERYQTWESRKGLFEELKDKFEGRALVSFFTSFEFDTHIDDKDCDLLQSVLRHCDLSKGLVLLINSPGGEPTAAERIAKMCRANSGTGEYWALVAGRAKSAATMICLGASKIMMAATAELGPVDPQVRVSMDDGLFRWMSAHSLVNAYDTLFKDATDPAYTGSIEPYVQQLRHFDAREIAQCRSWIALSSDISARLLSDGMLRGIAEDEIKKKINIFLDPAITFEHGRPIYSDTAKACDLNIDEIDLTSTEWNHIYELYVRTDMFVSSFAATAVESLDEALSYSPPAR